MSRFQFVMTSISKYALQLLTSWHQM